MKKMESRERAKIVNFSKIKLWNSPKPTPIEPPTIVEQEDWKSEKRQSTKRSMSRCQNFNDKHSLKQLQTQMKFETLIQTQKGEACNAFGNNGQK
jgi:hypothetical protein